MTSSVVRDPIHGLIALEPQEWEAVGSPTFQRLRSVRQLALTYLVYPGALHSRFEHSLGVLHIASRLAAQEQLDDGQLDVPTVRAASLLHDVGHGIFSHVSEQVIDEISGVDGVHEAVSAYLIEHDPAFLSAFGRGICKGAADLVALRSPRSVQRDIVSGPTDADKLDYLLRDSYFAGVSYGRYDLDRIIDSVQVIAPRSAQTQLGFDVEGIWAVEELLLARHHMHRQVYGHKTRLATDIMITRALRLALQAGVLPERAYRVDVDAAGQALVTQEFVEAYLQQTDVLVLEALRTSDVWEVADLANRLATRRLLRRTASIKLDEQAGGLGYAQIATIRDPEEFTSDVILEIEGMISSELGLEQHLVALYVDSRANPTYRNPGRSIGPKDIMVQRADEAPNVLHRESPIFRDEQGADDPWIYLYTPSLGGEFRDQRAKELLCTALRDL